MKKFTESIEGKILALKNYKRFHKASIHFLIEDNPDDEDRAKAIAEHRKDIKWANIQIRKLIKAKNAEANSR